MIIVKYEKCGVYAYLSFLDIRNAIQRTINRAKIKINKSQGFNPHQLMFFPDPDSLGINSKCDYFFMDCDDSIDYIKNSFNNYAPSGLKFCDVQNINQKITFNNIFSYAEYKISFSNKVDINFDFLNCKSILVKKEKSKDNEMLDIKSGVYRLKVNENSIECILSYGLKKINPNYIIKYFENTFNVIFKDVIVEKINVFSLDNGQLQNVDNLFFPKNTNY